MPTFYCISNVGTAPESIDMPLKKGSSRKVIGENIGIEEAHGKPPAQAAAIAYHVAGKFKAKRKKPDAK